jgi:hypothetical protein
MREQGNADDPEDTFVIKMCISLVESAEGKSESTLNVLQDHGDSFIASEVKVLLERLRIRVCSSNNKHQLAIGGQLHQDGFRNLVDLIGADEKVTDSEAYLQHGKAQLEKKREILLSPSTLVGGKISFDLTRMSTLSFLLSPLPMSYKSTLAESRRMFGEPNDPGGPTWNLSRRDMLLVSGLRAATELVDCLQSVDVGLQLKVEFVVHEGATKVNPRQGCKQDNPTTAISRDLQTDTDYLLRGEQPLEAVASPLEDLQTDIDYMLRNMVRHESSTPLQDISLIGKETTPLPPSIEEDLTNQPVVGMKSIPEEVQTDTDHMLRNMVLLPLSTPLLDTGLIGKETTPLPLSIEEELTKQPLGCMASPPEEMQIDIDHILRNMEPDASSTPLQRIGCLIGKETTPLPLSIKEELANQPVVAKKSTPEELQTDHILLNMDPGASSTPLQDIRLNRKETSSLLPSVEGACKDCWQVGYAEPHVSDFEYRLGDRKFPEATILKLDLQTDVHTILRDVVPDVASTPLVNHGLIPKKPTPEAEAAMRNALSPDIHTESAVVDTIVQEDSMVKEEDRIECTPFFLAELTSKGNMEKDEQVVTPVTPKDASPAKQRCETAVKSPSLPRSPHLDSQGMDLSFLSQLPYSMRSEARLAFAVHGPRSRTRSNNMCMDKWMASKQDAPSVTASQVLPTDIDPLVWSELPREIRQSIEASMQGPARGGGQQRHRPAKRKGGISSFFSANSKKR